MQKTLNQVAQNVPMLARWLAKKVVITIVQGHAKLDVKIRVTVTVKVHVKRRVKALVRVLVKDPVQVPVKGLAANICYLKRV